MRNINNSEREYKGREKKYQKGRQNVKTANSGKQTRVSGRGGGPGDGVTG